MTSALELLDPIPEDRDLTAWETAALCLCCAVYGSAAGALLGKALVLLLRALGGL